MFLSWTRLISALVLASPCIHTVILTQIHWLSLAITINICMIDRNAKRLDLLLATAIVGMMYVCNAEPTVGAPIPADTNAVSFVGISRDAATSNAVLTLYAPTALPVDVFAGERLDSGDWSLCASTNALHPFTELTIPSPVASRFFAASRGDVDLDGDGIPDGREAFLYHTKPSLWDTGGDGLSDGVKVAQGLNPLLRDTDCDGFDDDEELASGSDPAAATSGSAATIRYIYDDDDRLTAAYVGASHGAATVALTPAGNPATLHERSAR